jgi:hypothetical protein
MGFPVRSSRERSQGVIFSRRAGVIFFTFKHSKKLPMRETRPELILMHHTKIGVVGRSCQTYGTIVMGFGREVDYRRVKANASICI